MIYFDLFWGFLKIGCFAFGGAYGAIPLIREVVLSYGWLTDEALANMIAISESTPGPIMINLATYVGSSQAGLPGAALATLAVTLPAFFTILLIVAALKSLLRGALVQAVLRGLKSCVTGVILATGAYMLLNNCVSLSPGGQLQIQTRELTVTLILAAAVGLSGRFLKKKIPPVGLIVLSAVLGAVICAF